MIILYNIELMYKVGYVADGNTGIMKDYLVDGSRLIQCVSAFIVLVLENINSLCTWIVDG